ncbi:MAG: hypothetical protein ABSH51_28420 [Solirubrobacteraceae bacterium]|jgi:hypothetical protein
MPNPVTATHDQADRHVLRPPAHVADRPDRTRFAPLFTRAARLAIMTVEDELGRPLVGVFVPDRWLL